LFALLAKVTVADVEVSGNENLNLMASSPTVDPSMGKGKSPMNETGEEQLMESELQKLKLPDNRSNTVQNIIDVPSVIIPQDTSYSIPQVSGSFGHFSSMLLLSLSKSLYQKDDKTLRLYCLF
jgi:hypothetical protein